MPLLTCNYVDNIEQLLPSVALLLSTTCAAILIIITLLALAFCIHYKRKSKKPDGKASTAVI